MYATAVGNLDPFSVYGGASLQPMREDVTSVTSSLIGLELALVWIENISRYGIHHFLQGPILLTWINCNSNMDN